MLPYMHIYRSAFVNVDLWKRFLICAFSEVLPSMYFHI